MVLKELNFNSFYFERVLWSLKNYILTVSTLGGCGDLKELIFYSFHLWEGVVFLKELIFNNFSFGRVWWS